MAAAASLGIVLDQLHQGLLRQGHRLHAADGGGAGRALAAVERGDLAEHVARPAWSKESSRPSLDSTDSLIRPSITR
jgi:hypothetical protein